MPRLTILFGIILILLGVFCYMNTGHEHPTSLIPSAIGLILAICGALARTTDLKRRGLAMHIAATVGVLGFLFTAKDIVTYFRMQGGLQVKSVIATEEKAATAVLLLVFTIACVRNFVQAAQARRLRA